MDTRFKKGRVAPNKIGTVKVCQTCSQKYPVRGTYRRKYSQYCSRSCAMIGKPSNWKGKSPSAETREKMRAAKLGIRGKQHWNWRPWTAQSRRDRVYFRDTLQKEIFKRDKYMCLFCRIRKNLQVDHIKSWSKYPELRFEPSNCRTLCMKCHYKVTFNKDAPEDLKAWGHNMSRRVVS